MKYEIKRNYAGAPEKTAVNWNNYETRFTAKEASEDAAYWVEFTLEAPIKDTYIMAPACAYDGNRFETVLRKYPPMVTEEEMGVDVPQRMTMAPHLKAEGDSFMDVTTGDMTVPCVCVFRKSLKEAFMVFFNQGDHGLNHGVTLEQKGDQLSVILRAPAKRRLVYRWYEGIPSLRENPAADAPLKVEAGDETVIPHQVTTFPCADITELYRVFFEKRHQHFSGKAQANLPFSAFWDIAEEVMNEKYFIEKEGYYSQVENNVLPDGVWQSGWVGSAMSTLSFLCDGNETSKKNALSTLKFVNALQSEIGWYYPVYREGEYRFDDFNNFEKGKYNMILTRRQGDMVLFMVKQIKALEAMGMEVPEHMKKGAIKGADALVNLWKRYGQLGQFVNGETGEIVVGNSSSCGISSAALCAVYEMTKEEVYLEVAREIAEYYYRTATAKGVTCGGPGEAMQAPDSESAAGLLESFVALYETDGDAKWLKYACDAAHQAASWVVSYDYEYSKDCRFGKMDIHTAGSVWANVQNKHSAPGLCTLSAITFLKIYRATGDEKYLEMMRQISHFIPQVASYPQRPMMPFWAKSEEDHIDYGAMCERVNMSDWEGNEHVGDAIFGPSNWPQATMMLTWTEIPGVYVVPSEGIVCVSDHVNAWMEDGCLKIQNPTTMDARVKVLVEEKEDMKENLGLYWQDRFKIVEVKAGSVSSMEI